MTRRCPCGNPVVTKEDAKEFVTGFAFGPPEANLGYHWSCAERLGVPRPPSEMDRLKAEVSAARADAERLRGLLQLIARRGDQLTFHVWYENGGKEKIRAELAGKGKA